MQKSHLIPPQLPLVSIKAAGLSPPDDNANIYFLFQLPNEILKENYFANVIFFYIFVNNWSMKRYKVKQVLDMLQKDGWKIKRIVGDHRQLKNQNGKSGTVTVSGKNSDTLSQEILNSIWKQAGWK